MNFKDSLSSLAEAIFLKRPILKKVIQEYGHISLIDYATLFRENKETVSQEIKDEFIGEIVSETLVNFGTKRAESIRRQLQSYYYVVTTNHIGTIVHPFFVHANILSALPYIERQDRNHENTIILACSNISLNNSSLPVSLIFHDIQRGLHTLQKLNLLPSRHHNRPMYRLSAFKKNDLKRIYHSIKTSHLKKDNTISAIDKIESVIRTVYDRPEIFQYDYFSDQISMANSILWKNFFLKSGKEISNLVYFEQEMIVLNLIKKYHLFSNTNINQFIFNEEISKQIIYYLDNTDGAFSLKNKKGTFLFWFLPSGGNKRVGLYRRNKTLVSFDEVYQIPLTADSLNSLIEKHQLIPGTMLSFVVLYCYYGVKCLGGFNQIDYLYLINKAYSKIFLSDFLKQSYGNLLESLCGDFLIAPLKIDDIVVPATGIDFILYGGEKMYDVFKTNATALKLNEVIYLMFPDLYTILYKREERDDLLASISQFQIIQFFDLEKKLLTIP